MDPVLLSRIQFALTIGFHYIFPPMSIGLGLILVIMEACYLRTKKQVYIDLTRFWVRIFGLIFALGVATGIVMEFQFGTNWSTYSRYVGDVFGSALAAEGIFAFFLESGFLALLLFGWDKVGPRMHFLSTCMVALGAHFSAIWIIVANSWMQTPVGFHINAERGRAEIADFWEVVFNPSTLDRLSHTLLAAWQAGAFLVLSVSAFYLLKKRHEEAARAGLRIALVVAAVAAVGSLASGHSSAVMLAEHQPAKLAAMEGHFEASAPADMYVWGWPREEERRVALPIRIPVPGMLGILAHGDASAPVTGLGAFPEDEWPPVNPTFQAFHIMVAVGMALLAISLAGLFFWWRRTLFTKRWLLSIMVASVVLPHIGNQLGWMVAEVGRQPWIVYGLLKTADAVSISVSAGEILASLILFGLIYILLFAVFIYLLNGKIRKGPTTGKISEATQRA